MECQKAAAILFSSMSSSPKKKLLIKVLVRHILNISPFETEEKDLQHPSQRNHLKSLDISLCLLVHWWVSWVCVCVCVCVCIVMKALPLAAIPHKTYSCWIFSCSYLL